LPKKSNFKIWISPNFGIELAVGFVEVFELENGVWDLSQWKVAM